MHKKFPLVITDKLGNVSKIKSYKFRKEAYGLLQQGIAMYKKHKYEIAVKLFNKALLKDKHIYPAYLGLGDCYLRLKNNEVAIKYYKKAVTFNPNDYTCFLKLGEGYISVGNYKKSINPLIAALVLSPRNKDVLKLLKMLEKKKIVILPDISFTPKAFIDKYENEVYIYFSKKKDQGVWYPYILTKAVWIYEPDFKEAGNGSKWFSKPDVCALENTLFFYFNQKNMKKILPDAKMDRLVDIQDARMLEEYVYYEIGSRIYPDLVLLQTTSFKRKLKQFITKFVVVKR
jgi:tetratricopeptide (TPR) repeat protein